MSSTQGVLHANLSKLTKSSFRPNHFLVKTMCLVTAPPSLPKKRVSFHEVNEVFSVEKVDARLIQDLFYSSEDFRRFRREGRTSSDTIASADANYQQRRRRNASNACAARRQKFQQSVATRNGGIRSTNSRLVLRESPASRGLRTLHGMRTHVAVANQ